MALLEQIRRLLSADGESSVQSKGRQEPVISSETKRGRAVEFSVVDVETTGLYSGTSDRIVEIAIVRATTSGDVKDEYCTLVNPERDIGPTHIHGIRAADVMSAPTFKEIAGDIADRISDVPVIGHNVKFDMTFLQAEYRRMGVSLPSGRTLCTLDLSYRASIPAVSRRLSSCCRALGIRHEDSHSALADARATTRLFSALVELIGVQYMRELGRRTSTLPPDVMAGLPRSTRTWTRQAADQEVSHSQGYLSRLVSSMPLVSPTLFDDPDSSSIVSYLDLLDRALQDRHISGEEAGSLMQLASDLGMDQTMVKRAHNEYVRELATAALADGIVTSTERDDLELVTRWLGLSIEELEVALTDPQVNISRQRSSLAGKSVCFTGDSCVTIDGEPISRLVAEQVALEAGMIVKSGVSKKLDMLVVADPLSQSGKAAKARAYGTAIVAEQVFWQMVGLQTD